MFGRLIDDASDKIGCLIRRLTLYVVDDIRRIRPVTAEAAGSSPVDPAISFEALQGSGTANW